MACCSLALQSLSLLTMSPLLSNTTIMPPQLKRSWYLHEPVVKAEEILLVMIFS